MSFDTLVTITDDLRAQYPQSEMWKTSPFAWIVSQPPSSKGAIGRDICSGLMHAYGLTPGVNRVTLRVNGQSVVVRLALLWEQGVVKFQNIRDTAFDHVICLGISPHAAMGWMIPKAEIWQDGKIRTDNAGIAKQHKGADAWVNIDPSNVANWLKPYGGTLEQLMEVVQTEL